MGVLLVSCTLLYALVPTAVYAESSQCYCVLWLRTVMGVDIRGDADTQSPDIQVRQVQKGDVALFNYGGTYHAALVVDTMDGDRFRVVEANWKHCQVTDRVVSLYDGALRGFMRPQAVHTGK